MVKENENFIDVVEVGPRDGLQSLKDVLPVKNRIQLIDYLLQRNFQHIEAGSFVHPQKVPAMAGSDEIAHHFSGETHKLWYLAPNLKGLQNALKAGCQQIAFFTASSTQFTQKNIGMSQESSLNAIEECLRYLEDHGYNILSDWSMRPQKPKDIVIRVYISTVIECPYSGRIKPIETHKVIERLLKYKICQFSLGDTLGVGTPAVWKPLLEGLDKSLIFKRGIALHVHDTFGMAIACIALGLQYGIRVFDSSIGGLGGCPYAPGASGNLATEDLLYFLQNEGFETHMQLDSLRDCFKKSRTGTLKNISKAAKALFKEPC